MAEPLKPGSVVDCHTHTRHSDGVGTFEENARAAVAAGCSVLVSTDHLTLPSGPMDPVGQVQVVEGDLAAYKREWEMARDAHPELEMILGFEADWYPGADPTLWTEIVEGHAGTLEDPIPVPDSVTTSGFEYEYGKYYQEDDTVYLCKRGGVEDPESMYGQKEKLYFPPSALIGQYFVLAE